MGTRYTLPIFDQPHSDRKSRERYGTHRHNLENYFEEFTIDPSSRHYINSRIFHTFDPRRLPLEHHIKQAGGRTQQRYMDIRLGSMAQVQNAMPFGRAMRKLHEQVTAAEQFYSSFQSDYDNEISILKRYAPVAVLSGLWRARVVGKRDLKTVLEGEERQDDENLREIKGKFDDTARDLRHALTTALSADFKMDAAKSNQNKIRCGEAHCLYERVTLSNTLIRQRLNNVAESREDCVLLVKQLVELGKIIDPESEDNRFLYQSPADEEDNNTSDDTASGYSRYTDLEASNSTPSLGITHYGAGLMLPEEWFWYYCWPCAILGRQRESLDGSFLSRRGVGTQHLRVLDSGSGAEGGKIEHKT